MSDFPTLKEELNRKTLETIEKIVQDHASGRINEAQYAYAIDVMWSAVAGLVDADFNIIIETMTKAKKDGSLFTREYYQHPTKGVVRLINTSDGRVLFKTSASTKLFDYREGINPHKEAKEKFRELGDKLVESNFEQI